MRKVLTYVSLALSSIILTSFGGCGKPPAPKDAQVIVKPYPSWYTDAHVNDLQYMYSTGNGENKDEAVRNALNNMISELGITIESTYESKTESKVSYGESVNKEIKNSIKANVSKIRISNYEVVSFEKMNYRETIVMVRSDKQKFADSLKKALDVKFDAIAQEERAVKSKDNLKKYNKYTELVSRAQAMRSEILVLSSVDKTFEQSVYLKSIAKLENAFLKAKTELKFYVEGDKNSAYFRTKIQNFISDKGLNLIPKNKAGAIRIKINTETTTSIVNDSIKVAVFTVDIKSFANQNRIGGKTLVLKERYNRSMSEAKKNASIHLEEDMKNQETEEILGLKIK